MWWIIFLLVIAFFVFNKYQKDKTNLRDIISANGGMDVIFEQFIECLNHDFLHYKIIKITETELEIAAVSPKGETFVFGIKQGFSGVVNYRCDKNKSNILNAEIVVEGRIANQVESYKVIYSELLKKYNLGKDDIVGGDISWKQASLHIISASEKIYLEFNFQEEFQIKDEKIRYSKFELFTFCALIFLKRVKIKYPNDYSEAQDNMYQLLNEIGTLYDFDEVHNNGLDLKFVHYNNLLIKYLQEEGVERITEFYAALVNWPNGIMEEINPETEVPTLYKFVNFIKTTLKVMTEISDEVLRIKYSLD
ncbi:MAG: hypothetical protein MUF42_09290 [Cytophagaceae bacterium]|jgi:hypothetical protein|nr:hypothetical protein [Cytophagaceae bacterium]